MRRHLAAGIALSWLLLAPGSAAALEGIPIQIEDDDRADAWSAGTTCSVLYYNICSDWVIAWAAWPGEVFGVCFDGCCGEGHALMLEVSRHYCVEFTPGYGFAATVAVYAADANLCPTGQPIATRAFVGAGWRSVGWDGLPVPDPFVITMNGRTYWGGGGPWFAVTDRPRARRPGDPHPCGLCYPVPRPNHSFRYGMAGSPLCPGEPLGQGACDAQLLWEVGLSCGSIAVDGTSWGQIKALYR
jgi:hypothetical protein